MKYYDENFVLKNDKLKTNGFYFNVIFDNHGAIHTNCYKFYPNGKMKFENTVDAHIPSTEEYFQYSETIGFYKFDKDTLFFTKDAHYYNKVKEYKGYFKGDTLYLSDMKLNKYEPFLFIENGKTLNTGVDPKRYPLE